ncbi:hypothetical protein OC846_001695 [Tilletia horrida]|uniref:PH domain-containing protein n=1 Tax=Tilletia horrida TaxID=155126 RepID=A0AAN6GUU0_9BASI|nr:hypothetical protein OC846_001695 [Tilletia horrida]
MSGAPHTPGGGAGLGSNLSFKMPARPGSSLRKQRQSTNTSDSVPSTPSAGPASFIPPMPSQLPGSGTAAPGSSSANSALPANPFEDATSPGNITSLFTPLGHRRGNSRSSDILLAAAAGSASSHLPGGPNHHNPSRPQSPSSSSVDHENNFDNTVTLSTAVAHALSASAQGRQRLQDLREGLENQTHAAAALGANLMDQLKRIDGMMDNLNQEMQALQSRQLNSSQQVKNASPTTDLDPEAVKEKETQNEMRRKIASLQSSIDVEVADMESNRLNLVKALINAGPKHSPTAGLPASASLLDMLAGLGPIDGLRNHGGSATRDSSGYAPESPSKNAAAAAAAAYEFLNSDPHSIPASRSGGGGGAASSLASLLTGAMSGGAGNGGTSPGGPTARQSDRRARNAAARSSITDQNLVNQLQEGLVNEIRRLQGLLSERDSELLSVRSQKDDAEKEAALWKPKAMQLIENEDALKQENWDLSVAKQTLAEQLAEAQSSLRKAETEKTRLNRDITKARETLDLQRAEIETHTAELERIKNLRETEAALARKERAGLQRDYSNLQTELQQLRTEGKRGGVNLSGLGAAALGAVGLRSASNSMAEDTSRAGDLSTPIAEEDDGAEGGPNARNLLGSGQAGSGAMSPSSSVFSEMPVADRSGTLGASASVLPGIAEGGANKNAPQTPSNATAGPSGTDATATELRIRLARAHQKSIKDAAERRKQKELIAQLVRELRAAKVEVPADLEAAASAAEAEDVEGSDAEAEGEGSLWLDEDTSVISATEGVKRVTRGNMPRSSTRPTIASRLGLGKKASSSAADEDELSDEEAADEAEAHGDKANASAAAGTTDASTAPAKPVRSRARPTSVSSTTTGSIRPETLGAALDGATTSTTGPSEPTIRETAEVSVDAAEKRVSLADMGAQTDEQEEEDVWEPAEEQPKMTDSQNMTDPVDDQAPLRAALAERDAAHAVLISKMEVEHRSILEELVRTHEGVLGDRDSNHARALESRGVEHTRAIEELQIAHEKALVEAKSTYEQNLADAKAAHAKELASLKSAHSTALADAQTSHEQTLAAEKKAAHDKALEQARVHQESALSEARSRHSKALAEQVAAGSAALAAAEALHSKSLKDRDAAHRSELDKVQKKHRDEIAKRVKESEAAVATAAAASTVQLQRRNDEHADEISALKSSHSNLIKQKDTAQLAALAQKDDQLKQARSKHEELERTLADRLAEKEQVLKDNALLKSERDAAVARAAELATESARAAVASGGNADTVSVSAEELERKLRPLSGVSDDSTQHNTDVESSDAFTDAEDHITPARTPTPAQASKFGLGGRIASGLAAAVGLGGAATQTEPETRAADGVGASVKEEVGVKRVILAELQDNACQTDELIWEAYKAELRAEGAAQAQSHMTSSSTITGLANADGLVVVGGTGKVKRNRDSISTFGGGLADDGDTTQTPASGPGMYSVGAVLGGTAAAALVGRRSMESGVTTGVDSLPASARATPVASLLDKTKPPHMQVPPPPAMPPPPGLSGRRSQPSPVLAGVPPRPTSPPPPELVSRVQQQQRSTLQVPGGSGISRAGGVGASVLGAQAGPNGNSSTPPMARQTSSSNLRSRKHSNENGTDHLSAHSRHSRRHKVPRKSSQTSFASDVTSELSRRMSFGSSRASDALADRTETHAQERVGGQPRSIMGNAPDGTDPDIIQAITQTMIGEYLYKYTRKTMRAGYSDKRHKRFFWVHPYTRMLYWTLNDPGGARMGDGNSKGACIEDIRVVEDTNPNPPGLFHMSIIVKTAAREMKLTAPNKERHDVWLAALGYLVNRGMPGGDATSMGDGGGLTDQENRMSVSLSPRKARDRSATTGTANSRSRFLSPARSLRSRKSNDAFLYGQGAGSDADATPRPRNGSIGANSTLNLSSTKRAGLPAREYLEQVETEQAAKKAVASQRALLPQRSHLRPRHTTGPESGNSYLHPHTPGKMSIGSAFGIPGSASVVGSHAAGSGGGSGDDSWDRLADLSSHSFNDPRLQTAEQMLEEDNEGYEGLVPRPSDVSSARSVSPAPQIGHLNLATNSEQAATWSAGSSAQPVRTGNFATMFTDSPIDGTASVNEFGKTASNGEGGSAVADSRSTAKQSTATAGSGRGGASEAFMNQVQRIKAARQGSSAR